jgi:hypothetical protein
MKGLHDLYFEDEDSEFVNMIKERKNRDITEVYSTPFSNLLYSSDDISLTIQDTKKVKKIFTVSD